MVSMFAGISFVPLILTPACLSHLFNNNLGFIPPPTNIKKNRLSNDFLSEVQKERLSHDVGFVEDITIKMGSLKIHSKQDKLMGPYK